MMRLIKGYFSDDLLRRELNELTMRIFGFDFENLMKFSYHGKEKNYIQIGTVMTAENRRNKGYACELITNILEDYRGEADGFYLFGNLNALGFYEKMGFQKGVQYRCSCMERSRPNMGRS